MAGSTTLPTPRVNPMPYALALRVFAVGLLCAATEKASCTLGQFPYFALSTHDPLLAQTIVGGLIGWLSGFSGLKAGGDVAKLPLSPPKT